MSSSEDDSNLLPSAQPNPYNSIFGGAGGELPTSDDLLPESSLEDDDLVGPASNNTDNVQPAIESKLESPEAGDYRLDSDPPDLGRPNKFHGAPSTWRDWTAAERGVAQSLEQLQAQDLSVHLYNAHALKVRARELRAKGAEGDDDVKADPWKPPKLWTAWPMAFNEVPRERSVAAASLLYTGNSTYPAISGIRSGKELEEVLLGIFTRKARERFRERYGTESERMPDLHNSFERHRSGETLRSRRGSEALTEDSQRGSEASSPERSLETARKKKKRKESETPSFKREEDQGNDEIVMADAEIKGTDSGNRRKHAAEPSSKVEAKLEDTIHIPVPIANDEVAKRLASPSIRHLISSLEVLLTGLHQARQLQAGHFRARKSQPASRSQSKERQASRGRPKPRRHRSKLSFGRASSSSGSEDQDSEAVSSQSDSSSGDKESNQRPGKRTRPYRGLGLRDWSDVLGIAAMQGWDQNAVERARLRCSALFGEHMGMTSLGFDEDHDRMDKSRSSEVASEDEMEGGVHVDGFLRPIKRRKGWRGRNKVKGNWISRRKEREQGQRSDKETTDLEDQGGIALDVDSGD